MKKSGLLIVSLFFIACIASANEYTIDVAKVDQLFKNAVEVTSNTMNFTNTMNFADLTLNGDFTKVQASDKNPFVAAILCFFLGGIAIHRYYLGTKSSMFFYYCCTLGGIFGVIPLIDFIVLLIDNKDISKYCNNEKFFMWM